MTGWENYENIYFLGELYIKIIRAGKEQGRYNMTKLGKCAKSQLWANPFNIHQHVTDDDIHNASE